MTRHNERIVENLVRIPKLIRWKRRGKCKSDRERAIPTCESMEVTERTLILDEKKTDFRVFCSSTATKRATFDRLNFYICGHV